MLGSLLRASPQPLPMGQITPSPGLLRYFQRIFLLFLLFSFSVWICPLQDPSLTPPTLDLLVLKSQALRTTSSPDLISTPTSHILT